MLLNMLALWVCDNAPSKCANGTPPWWALAVLLIAVVTFIGVLGWGVVELFLAILRSPPEYDLQ